MKPLLSKISNILPEHSVVFIIEKDKIPDFARLTDAEKNYVQKQLSAGEKFAVLNDYKRFIYIVSLKDKTGNFNVREDLRRSAYKLRKLIKSNNHDELVISSENSYIGAVEDFTEGLILSVYSFDKYITDNKEENKKHHPAKLLLHGKTDDNKIKWLKEVTDAVWFVRDWVNEPVNHLNAVTLAMEIKKKGEEAGFSVEIFNKMKIESLKMGGLLAVNRGSIDPPSFSILEWKPEGHLNINPIVLVGKGIVYDTGGLNIKTGDYMSGMKGDMAGAAIVTGALYVAARTGIPLHIVGLVPSTDNRPGENAYTQGDIITMHNNTTVEIGNTDAEGGLILADAISYASKYKPEFIINIATLTGSAAMTFGAHAIAAMSNAKKKYIDMLKDAGDEVYERIAELPLWEEYGEALKSDVADIRNVGGREAGAITAGKFLEKFTSYPLIHLDIAGNEILKKDEYYKLKNGTGTGLRLLSVFLKKLAESY
ncbi:MAG TPA: peptidase M17 [Bacteroidales bacterium]|nr:peptidase M17 [Bacteroidales bacterium]